MLPPPPGCGVSFVPPPVLSFSKEEEGPARRGKPIRKDGFLFGGEGMKLIVLLLFSQKTKKKKRRRRSGGMRFLFGTKTDTVMKS